jgi:two-component system response regulator
MTLRADTILLVDDSPDDIYFTARAVRQCNITGPIVVAHDGVEALELLLPDDNRPPLCPALTVLDMHMPRMNGLDVLARLRANSCTSFLPVIVLTSSDHDEHIAEDYGLGASSFVRKPVHVDEFLEAARILGVSWVGMNEQAHRHQS